MGEKEPPTNPLALAGMALGSGPPYTTEMADFVWSKLDQQDRDAIAGALRPLIEAQMAEMKRSLLIFKRLGGDDTVSKEGESNG